MSFRNVGIFLIVIFSLFSFSPRIAFASCAPPISLAKYKEQADIVVLGRVTSISNPAVIKVERYFKGHGGPSQIEVYGKETDTAVTSVDFTFEEDKKYILFLQMDSGKLKTNACMGNREVLNALNPEDLAVLGTGYVPNGDLKDLSPSTTNEKTSSISNKNIITVVGVLLLVGVVAISWKKWSETHLR